jgi:hypothetical protein
MWTDNWLGDSLLSLLNLPDALAPSLSGQLQVSSLNQNRQWVLLQMLLSFPLVADRIQNTIIPIRPLQDCLVWLHSLDDELSFAPQLVPYLGQPLFGELAFLLRTPLFFGV